MPLLSHIKARTRLPTAAAYAKRADWGERTLEEGKMNPPHILIARNSRGPNTHNPSASLSSPTETHAAAAGIFRSAGSPSWYLEECESDEMASSLSTNGDMDDPIEIDETFTKSSKFPGNVKIVVESTTFWCVHRVSFRAIRHAEPVFIP